MVRGAHPGKHVLFEPDQGPRRVASADLELVDQFHPLARDCLEAAGQWQTRRRHVHHLCTRTTLQGLGLADLARIHPISNQLSSFVSLGPGLLERHVIERSKR